MEWANVFKADIMGLGFGIKKDLLDWSVYDLAIVFAHDVAIGSAKLVRKKAGKDIKIVTIPEPPPSYLLSRTPFGFLNKMVDDFNVSDLVAVAHECYVDDWRGRFKCGKKMQFMPVPINIVEYENLTNLAERKNIIASTGHCNFAESSRRSWYIIKEALPRIRGYRTRCFYAHSLEELRGLGTQYDEACPFIWDTTAHVKRLNECKVFVDDNISPASGHITLEVICMGIPCVGSNDFMTHLFPELSLRPHIIHAPPYRAKSEVRLLSEKLVQLVKDENYYKAMVALGRKNLYKWYSYEACKERLLGLLKDVSRN